MDRGYDEVRTPILYDVELWKQSGHWDNYRDNMYFTEVEDQPMGLKPMNCPAHIQIYKSRAPLLPRPADPLRRGRASCTATSPAARSTACCACATSPRTTRHIFCTEDQIEEEVAALPRLRLLHLRRVRLRAAAGAVDPAREAGRHRRDVGHAPRPRSHARSTSRGLEYEVNEGDGAFYGPKIDLHMTDSIGRSWQLGTVQLDYYMPERFELAYTGADNAEHRPVMIHRALLGSFERFIGILIEHYAGEFPLWLAPVQALVLPIADRHAEYAARGRAASCARRACASRSTTARESVGRKIRDGELRKVPYMLVVGDREAEAGTVAVRRHGEGDLGAQPVAELRRATARGSRRGPRAAPLYSPPNEGHPHHAPPPLTRPCPLPTHLSRLDV